MSEWSGRPLIDRFLDSISPEPNSGCWLWTKCGTHNGYGWIKRNGKHQYAHRTSYELFVGPIPEGLQIDHLCRVRCCVNPRHLEPVTRSENIRRGELVMRAKRRISFTDGRTHCPHGHPWIKENWMFRKPTAHYMRGHVQCRLCHNATSSRACKKIRDRRRECRQLQNG